MSRAEDDDDIDAPEEASSDVGAIVGDPEAVAGTVAIVGRPNVGKSTLLNQIVGQKLAIVSDKPQTTRNRIVGVWTRRMAPGRVGDPPGGQIVFVDTPGVHFARSALNKYMVDQALAALGEVDAVLLVVEPPERPAAAGVPASARSTDPVEDRLLEQAKASGKPVVLAINKVDRVKDKAQLFPTLEAWSSRHEFAALVPVSARRGTGVDDVVREILRLLPKGPPLFDPEMLTDRTERFLAGELIREQLFQRLRQELPYSTAVIVDNWQDREQGDAVIDATIMVERESQKAIVVGKAGAMIKEIGSAARQEISKMAGRPVHVRVHVKVAPDWTDSPEALARLGYKEES